MAAVEVCRAFRNTGKCRNGDACKFEHSFGDAIKAPPAGECFNFKQDGACQFGDRCRLMHGTNDPRFDADGRRKRTERAPRAAPAAAAAAAEGADGEKKKMKKRRPRKPRGYGSGGAAFAAGGGAPTQGSLPRGAPPVAGGAAKVGKGSGGGGPDGLGSPAPSPSPPRHQAMSTATSYRRPRVGGSAANDADEGSELRIWQRSTCVRFPEEPTRSSVIRIRHDPSFYNQYPSKHHSTSVPTMLRDAGATVTHLEVFLAPPTATEPPPPNEGVTFVMECKVSYIRDGPHGGGLLHVGRYGLSRALLAANGLLDGEWHTYCLRVFNDRATVLVDWSRTIQDVVRDDVPEGDPEAIGYLGRFFAVNSLASANRSDVESYVECGNIVPRRITLSAHYSNNHQMGWNKLSVYARVDCDVRNIIAWDYGVSTIRQCYVEHSRELLHTILFSLAVLVREGVHKKKFRLPHDVVVVIAKFAWPDCPFFSHREAVRRLMDIF